MKAEKLVKELEFLDEWLAEEPAESPEFHDAFGELMHTVLTCSGTECLHYFADEAERFLLDYGTEIVSEEQRKEAEIDAKYAPLFKQEILRFKEAFDSLRRQHWDEINAAEDCSSLEEGEGLKTC